MTGEQGKGGELVDLCRIDDLPASGARGFDLRGNGRDTLFVLRHGDGLRAYFNLCPHLGSSLPWQKDKYLNAESTRIVCHAHGAQFDIDTGECVLGPALGKRLFPVELSVETDGMVRARVGRIPDGDKQ